MTLDSKLNRPSRIGIWLLLSALMGLAITHQSLWMDEGFTVWFASQRTIAAFFTTLIGSRGAPGDPQMIFYLLYIWAWVKLWGASEVALRAANIPFAILLLGTVSWASRTLFRQPYAWMLFCLSPFMWFYMNDARPYVAVMAFAAVAVVAELAYLMRPAEYRVAAPWCCLVAMILTWGSHILGVFLFPSLAILAIALTEKQPAARKRFLQDWSLPALALLPIFLGLGAFFLWASRLGVNMQRGEAGTANLAFVFYEFLGFAGLGPSRSNLRANPHVGTLFSYWPWLLIGAAAAFIVGYSMLRAKPGNIPRHLAVSLLAGFAIALIVSKIAHLQLLGRHVAVLFPMIFILFLSTIGEGAIPSRNRYAVSAALIALGLAWSISDLRLVLLPQYEKESYRAASSISVMMAGQDGGKILWAADDYTAGYYGVRVTKPHSVSESTSKDMTSSISWPVLSEATDVGDWTVEEATEYIAHRPGPLVLVLSRPDLFDRKRGWRTLIERQKPAIAGHPTGFEIYEWPARTEAEITPPPSASQSAAQSLPAELGSRSN